MTLLEYVQSLQDQGATDIPAKVQKWKKQNQPDVEEKVESNKVEEAKPKVVVEKDAPAATTPEASENLESGNGELESQESNFFKPGMTPEEIDQARKLQKQYVDYASVAKPNEVITKNGFDLKYDTNGEYFYKPKGSDNSSWKTYDNKQSAANLSIASQFGHSDFNLDEYNKTKDTLKQGEELYIGIDGGLNIGEPKERTLSPKQEELEKKFLEETALTDDDENKIETNTNKWFNNSTLKETKKESYTITIPGGGTQTRTREVPTGNIIPNPEWEQAEIESKKAWDALDSKPEDVTEQEWIETDMKSNHANLLKKQAEKEKLETWIESQEGGFDLKKAVSLFGLNSGTAVTEAFDRGDKQKMVEAIQQTRKLNLDDASKNANDFATTAKSTLEGLTSQMKLIADAKYQTPKEVAQGKALLAKLSKKRDEVLSLYEGKVEDLNEMMLKPEYKDLGTRLDYLTRNFNPVAIYSENVKVGIANAGVALADLAHMVADARNAFGIEENPYASKALSIVSPLSSLAAKFVKSQPYQETREEMKAQVENYVNQTMQGIAHSQTLSDLKDGSDWGRYFSTMLGSQTFNTAVMFGTGGAALPILTAQAVGSSYGEMEKENKKREDLGLETFSPFQMYTTAMGNGVLEYASERISLGIIGRSRAAFNAMGPSVKQGFAQQVSSLLTKKGAARAAKATGYYALDVTKEGLSEGGVELGSNLFDRIILGKNVNLFEGVADATFSGAVMAGGVYKAPALFANISQMVQGPDSNTKIANNQQKIKDLENTIASNPKMSKANMARLNDQIVDLVKDSSNEINKTLNRFTEMDRSEIDALSDLELGINIKRKAIDEVNADPNFNDKSAEINRIQNEILELDIKKNKILEPYIQADSDIDTSQTVDLTQRVQEGSDVVAEQLGDTGISRFDTTEEFLGGIETLKAQGIKVEVATNEAGETLDAKDQGYGLIATLPDGTQQVIINNASSEADGVLPADKHEILHAFAAKMDPAKLAKMGMDLKNSLDSNPNIKVSAETQSLLNEYEADLKDGKINEATFYEEVMAVTSDALTPDANGNIGITVTKPGKLKTFLNNFLETIGWKQSFKDGDQVLDFLKGFNSDVMSGKGLSQQTLDTAEVDMGLVAEVDLGTVKESRKLTPEQDQQAQNKVKEIQELQKEGEALAKKFDKPFVKSVKQQRLETELAADIKPTVDSFVESRTKALYDPIAPDAKKGVTRQDFVESMKSDITTMVNNEFLAKQPLEKFITSRGFLRANSLAERLGIKSVEQGIDQSIDTASNVTTKTDSDVRTETETRKAQSPRETTKFTSDFVGNLDVNTEGKTQAEINEDVQKQFDEAIAKDLEAMGQVTTFGQTKNIGPALAALIEKATGMPAKVFTDKTKNISKKDATSGALTAVKQYLDTNAQRDFNNLPDAFASGTGKATFIPENVKKALYKKNDKGQFVLDKSKTIKDYRDLLGDMVKPVYRASEAQTIKGLIALSLRNRIFEQAVPDAIARKTTGVKFSKKPKIETLNKKQLDEVKEVSNLKNINQVTEKTDIGDISITPENRVEVQAQTLQAIEKYGLDLNTFLGSAFANSGRQYQKINDVKFFTLTDGSKVKEGTKAYNKAVKDGTFLPARGRLYYGVTDPAFKLAKEAAILNTKKPALKSKRISIKKDQKIDKNFVDKNLEQSKINMDILENTVNQLQEAVNNGMSMKIAATFIAQGYQATRGIIKIAAPFVNVSTSFDYATDGKASDKTGAKFREEHNPPASVIGASIIWGLKNNATGPVMEAIRKNYTQTQLSKIDDTKLDRAGLASTLPEGYSIFDNPVVRFTTANINLNNIIDAKTGKTLAEINNVGVQSKASKKNPNIIYAQNKLINEQLVGDIKVDVTMDKAAMKKFDTFGMVEVVSSRLFDEANYFKLNDNQKAKVQAEMISKDIAKLAQDRIKAYEPIAALELKSSKKNTKTYGGKVNPEMTIAEQLTILGTYDQAARKARALDAPKKGISVFDFDDTLAKTKEKVIVNKLDGTSTEISAAKFAETATQLESEGATFDFSNFEGVAKGTAKGPLADLALRRQDKFGSKDIFVLTARPQASAQAIQTFLDGIGLNLPIENITGLADGSPIAKGNWVAGKAAQGYNDFYFADDAYKNVEAVQEVLSQVDVDSKVQIAKESKKKTFDKVFNDIIESSTGIETFKDYSKAKGIMTGKNKGKFSFFTTPSAEDFLGLLYKTLGKGKIGDAQLDFYKKNLLDPYDRAELSVTKAKIQAASDFKALKRNLKTLPKSLSKEMGYGGFTFSQAARVAAWTRQGLNVPGLSKTDLRELNKFIDNNAEMNTFVDELIKIQKGKPYPAPSKDWLGGTITTDILNDINKVNRKEYLQEWQENVDIIFSEKNMSKLEAAYGPKYVEALNDTLRRMKSGSNRPIGGSRVVNGLLDWLNNSVGAIMFLNTRSAVLQTLSAVNFIGVGNNSLINSAKALANQKQYWKDFKTLMNSPYLVERRNGLKINVSESEIADAVAESSNKPKAALSYLLNKGFVLTRFADSFAIATGGAAFYRNQLDMYTKQGLPAEMAQEKAFEDFYSIAEKNQQSSNPSKISQQQASGAGRVVLAFANTPMQYARIIKRSAQDLKAGRGDWKKNVGTIAFYGVAQNVIFNALQNALFADAFGEDDEDEKKEDKTGRIANGMADSLLSGLGIQGKAVLSIKNALITLAKENNKKSPKFVKAVYDLFDFSPPLDSKFRKLRSAANAFTWDRQLMKEKGFSLDNPAYLAGAQVISGLTNLPLDRAMSKINNIRGIMSEQSEKWQKIALALGWSTWDVGLGYYGGFDPVKPLTPEQQYDLDVSNMKKETTTAQQKQTLLDLGLTRAEIKKLRYEEDRVKKIIALQKKKKDARSKK